MRIRTTPSRHVQQVAELVRGLNRGEIRERSGWYPSFNWNKKRAAIGGRPHAVGF